MMTLAKVIRSQPYDAEGNLVLARYVDGTSAIAYLGQRGVDPASLLEYGFGRLLLLTVDSTLAIDELENGAPTASAEIFDDWRRLRRQITKDLPSSDQELRLSKTFRERLTPWISANSISDVLRWTPPTDLDSPAEPIVDTVNKEYIWFVERFTKTYLSDWSDESLSLEYRYVLEHWRPERLPSELLLEREVAPDNLCREISSRTVHGRTTDPLAQLVLVERALEAIREQKRDVAAAIFTAARTLTPNDPSLANNLGFCLIPDNPVRAIQILAEARSLGHKDLLNFANTAAAHVVAGDLQGALDVCETAAAFGLASMTHVAWLWILPLGDDPTVLETEPGAYICDLAIVTALNLGGETLAERWRTRRSYIRSKLDLDGGL